MCMLPGSSILEDRKSDIPNASGRNKYICSTEYYITGAENITAGKGGKGSSWQIFNNRRVPCCTVKGKVEDTRYIHIYKLREGVVVVVNSRRRRCLPKKSFEQAEE
mmetsp:Transcript_4824/g.10640  ORF Transcript_4824/g.10640 Transcript_4824/m.10640 type:complete len:106 (-) Transcript_4824:263-580(-)